MEDWVGYTLLVLLVILAAAGLVMALVTVLVERPVIRMMQSVAAEKERARRELVDYESRHETLPGRDK